MRLLLDSHAFIWLTDSPERVPAAVLRQFEQPRTEVFLSIASVWEMQIKAQKGGLDLRAPLSEIVGVEQAQNNLILLPIHVGHVWRLAELPVHHRDPFDRMLVAQAQVEDMHLVTSDRNIAKYKVKTLWQ